MNRSSLPIGVFDSGLGGLTVLRSLIEMLPQERFVYLGDTARTPYGSKGPETIKRYSEECARFLVSKDVKTIIVACNTSSSHALGDLMETMPCPVIGTVEPAVRKAIAISKTGRIGVIGTEATVTSAVYENEFRKYGDNFTIVSKACPLFVPLVEQGMFSGEIVEKVVELYLDSIRAAEIDTLVLGCTHYPLLSACIQSFLGSSVKLVACSDAIAEVTRDLLVKEGMSNSNASEHHADYFVTDAVQRFNALAGVLMGRESLEAHKVEL